VIIAKDIACAVMVLAAMAVPLLGYLGAREDTRVRNEIGRGIR
jgi:hypothetical protein